MAQLARSLEHDFTSERVQSKWAGEDFRGIEQPIAFQAVARAAVEIPSKARKRRCSTTLLRPGALVIALEARDLKASELSWANDPGIAILGAERSLPSSAQVLWQFAVSRDLSHCWGFPSRNKTEAHAEHALSKRYIDRARVVPQSPGANRIKLN